MLADSLREDIPESEKLKPEYYKRRLDWAEQILKDNSNTKDRMTRLYDSYNGVKTPESLAFWEKTYGRQNKSKYIAYRLGRTKVDLLQGEWLKRPLNATVMTINVDAMSSKMQQRNFMLGAMVAKDELTAIKENAGVDIMNGAPIPQSEDDPIWQKMSFKDKQEDVMQIILDNQIKDLDVKKKLSEDFKNCEITNYVWCKVERNETGDIELHSIDPRNKIAVEIEGDDYYEKSPIKGARQVMPVQQILLRYELTKDQRDKLDEARVDPSLYTGNQGISRGYMTYENGHLLCDVIHIEWDSVTAEYYKVVPKTASQLALDPSESTLTLPMDAQKYEANIEYHNKRVKNGDYQIVTKYRSEKYEATRIGGIIDVNMRKVMFQKRSVDDPSRILNSTYIGYCHGRVAGVSVSLQQVIENFDNLYDIVKYQQLKELARMKGKVITIDRAGLGQKQKIEEVMYRMTNDQLLDYDSAAAGNMGRNLDPANMFKEIDMGLSKSFPELVALEQNIINSINQITGINENRQGITAASSTATAQQSDIANSRTITESLFFGFSGYVARVIKAIVDASAVSWAFYKTEKGEQILGTEKFQFLKVTQELGMRDYGVYIEDGSKYMEVSQKIDAVMQMAINAKTIDAMDVMNVLLAETLAQKKAFLEEAMIRTQRIAQEQMQAQNQAQAQMQQQQLATQLQIATDDREDKQNAVKEEIILQGQVDIEKDNNKARNDMALQNMKGAQDIILNTTPEP